MELLHTRKYISYHENRYSDYSYVCRNNFNEIVAVFPAALSIDDSNVVESHPGLTFSGIIFSQAIRGQKCIEILFSLCNVLKSEAKTKLIYKIVPDAFKLRFFQDDKYALHRLGAICHRLDLSAAIDLINRGKLSTNRKRNLSKASKFDLRIRSGPDLIPFSMIYLKII